MPKKIGVQLFIEPIGKYTNDAIGQYLADAGIVNESVSTAGHTYQGKHIDTFLIAPEHAIKFLNNQQTDKKLHFNIYYSRFGNHELTKWKNSDILYDTKTGKLQTVLEFKERVEKKEKEMATKITEMINKLGEFKKCYAIYRNPKKFLPILKELSQIYKALDRETLAFRRMYLKEIKRVEKARLKMLEKMKNKNKK